MIKRTNFPRAIIIFLSILLLSNCSDKQTENHTQKDEGSPVIISSPFNSDLTEYLQLNANTVFINKEIVRATFAGFLENIYKNIGDEVTAGDQLFSVKTKESAADDSLVSYLYKDKFSGTVVVKSHSSGILTELNFHPGDYITEGDQLCIISNPSSLLISLNVPYQFVSKVRKNSFCKVILPDGKSVNAIIKKILPSVDSDSQTQTYLLELTEKIFLPENLNVSTEVPINTIKNALVVNKNAVMSNETLTNFWVMKLINDSTAVRIDIQKGFENDSLVQILNPIFSLNDKILFSGAYGLPDTAKVSIQK